MNKISILILFLLLISLLNAVSLRILFTNDTHSYYTAKDYQAGGKKYSLGGYVNLERLLNQERNDFKRNLTFDSGDEHTGTVFSKYVYEGVKGGAVVEVMNQLKYSAATFGNHEFDHTLADVKGYMRLAKFPYINSNLMVGKRYFSSYPYKIFQLDSLKVGVIGLIMTDLNEKVSVANVKGLTILPYKQAIDKVIDEVDKQSDLVVVLTHIGVDADSLLATQLDSRVDVILGGHTHAILEQPLVVNGILITEAGAQLIYLGELDVEVKDDRISSWKHRLIPVEEQENPPTELSKFVDDIAQKVETELGEKLGDLTVPWIPDKYKETAVSRWQAKALYEEYREKSGAEFSIINCGGIRSSMKPGPITLKQMQEMVPFGNIIQTFTCKGQDICNMLELNLQLSKSQANDIVQVYPITYDIVDSFHVSNVKINGQPINLKQTYKGVSHDYVLTHADKYLAFTPKHVKDTKVIFVDQLINYIKKHEIVGE
jgi:5'-nucleotidase / UDP-sugar diphosphatase